MTDTYIRRVDPNTGKAGLAVHFTAPLYSLYEADSHDPRKRLSDLADDVRDRLHTAALPSQDDLFTVRARLAREIDEVTGITYTPEIFATVAAYLTDAEPGDPRLEQLLKDGFISARLDDVPVRIVVPTEESEAELEKTIAEAHARSAAEVQNITTAAVSAPAKSDSVDPADFDAFFSRPAR